MKKKILSIILVLALTLTMFSVDVKAASLVDYDTNAGVSKIECVDSALMNNESNSKNAPKYKVLLGAGETAFAYPISIKSKGSVIVTIYNKEIENITDISQLTDMGNVEIELYSGQECSPEQKVASANAVYMFAYIGVMNVKKGGDYFVKINFPDAPKDKACEIAMIFMHASGVNQTLKASGSVASSFVDKTPIYYKFTAKSDGYLSLNTGSRVENESYKIVLCDKNKKELSKASVTESIVASEILGKKFYNKVFAVQKGTYYIKAVPNFTIKPGITSGLFAFDYKFTNLKDTSGVSKAKAKALKTAKAVSGMITCTERKSDWYKFTVTKAKKATINLNKYLSSGDVKIEIYNSKGKKVSVKTSNKTVNYVKQSVITSKSTLAKGTYYIKISESNKQASGYYSISVK